MATTLGVIAISYHQKVKITYSCSVESSELVSVAG